MPTAIAAVIQMNSGTDIAENLRIAEQLIATAAAQGAALAVLPEMFGLMGATSAVKLQHTETDGSGVMQDFLAAQAQRHHIWLVGGTIPLATTDPTKLAASCLVFDSNGARVARYDKMHLFDVYLSDQENYCESADTLAGDRVVVVDTPIGKLGLSVCYDIRFPELYQTLRRQGAEIFAIPAAFTVPTGQAHWQLLARARAVENVCYVLGAAEFGTFPNGRTTYGHSLIVDPWGTVLEQLDADQSGVICAPIDLDFLNNIRHKIPLHLHKKLAS